MNLFKANLNAGSNRTHVVVALMAVFFSSVMGARQTPAQEVIDASAEAKVKSVYIYNFSRFTTWPNAASQDAICIGIVGSSAVADNLRAIAAKRSINNKPIDIRLYSSASDVLDTGHDIVFFGRAIPQAQVAPVLAQLKDLPVLTVTDSRSAPLSGAVINFVLDQGAVHFELDNEEAHSKDLAMDARLLRQGRKMVRNDGP